MPDWVNAFAILSIDRKSSVEQGLQVWGELLGTSSFSLKFSALWGERRT